MKLKKSQLEQIIRRVLKEDFNENQYSEYDEDDAYDYEEEYTYDEKFDLLLDKLNSLSAHDGVTVDVLSQTFLADPAIQISDRQRNSSEYDSGEFSYVVFGNDDIAVYTNVPMAIRDMEPGEFDELQVDKNFFHDGTSREEFENILDLVYKTIAVSL